MGGLIRSFQNLPLAIKVVVIALLVASFGAALVLLPAEMRVVVGLGLAAVIVASLLYGAVLRLVDRGRGGPFLRRLMDNAGVAPSGVNDPGARARLDDMRRRFQEGMQTFKDHGKEVYSIPWYALVGEPGSGKTEAIRHCNVGFPPGLQDQLQGAGGTLNMNWWFTNHAVILDTAGRLMFEEAPPGKTTEWKEFLRLLRTARPNCPLNGLLLVIPSESVIKDSDEEIARKAGRIAEQLDSIQKTLGVRFPVFVIITKSDLINGFREFFDDVTDPVLQHQMLGWSNPNPLDTPFDPGEVERHLESVRERLLRRRMGLLVDPVNTDNPARSRLDQVDAMYVYPDAMMQIAPRLRRYLETIFVAGEWSAKPLFLRGIYFTSSMRDGQALDAELADALGVRVEALPEGKIWEKDRAFFLKDLFLDKVFRERGLVTRAASTSRLKRQRQAVVLGVAGAVLAALGVLTWFGHRELEESILEPRDFWSAVSGELSRSPETFELVYFDDNTGQNDYGGSYELDLRTPAGDRLTTSLAGLHERARDEVEKAYAPPAVFGPIATLMGDPFEDREEAQAALFGRSVVGPVFELARDKLVGIGENAGAGQAWGPDSAAALAELARAEAIARRGDAEAPDDADEPAGPAQAGAPRLDGPVRFLLAGNERAMELWDADHEGLQTVANRTYAALNGPPWHESAAAGTERSLAALTAGVEALIARWSAAVDEPGTLLADVRGLVALGREVRRLEDELLADRAIASARTASEMSSARDGWRARLLALRDASAGLDERVAGLAGRVDLGPEALAERARGDVLGRAAAEYDVVRDALAGSAPEIGSLRARLDQGWSSLEQAVDRRVAAAASGLTELRGPMLAPVASAGGERGYRARIGLYERAEAALTSVRAAIRPAELPAALERVDGRLAELLGSIGREGPGEGERAAAARASVEMVARAAARRDRTVAIAGVLDAMLAEGGVRAYVEEQAASVERLAEPQIPLTGLVGREHPAPFQPAAADGLLRAGRSIADLVAGGADQPAGGTGPIVLDAASLQERAERLSGEVAAFLTEYRGYWTETVPARASVGLEGPWPEAYRELIALRPRDVNPALADLAQQIVDALEVAGPESEEAGGASASLASQLRLEAEGFRALRGVTERCMLVQEEWRRLGPDVAGARADLLAVSPALFMQNHLLLYDEGASTPGASYWSDLSLALLESLAVSAETQAQEAMGWILQNAQGFPLALDFSRELTPDQVAEAVMKVGLLAVDLNAAGDGRGSGAGGLSSADLSMLGSSDVASLLARVRGDTVIGPHRRLVEKLAPVAAFLDPAGGGPEWELVMPGYFLQSDPTAADIFRYVEIRFGDRTLRLNGAERRVQSDRAIADTGLRFRLPTPEDVVFEFAPTSDGQVQARGRLAAPWGALRALAAAGERPLSSERNPELPKGMDGVWKHPLRLTVEPGSGAPEDRPLTFEIGVRLGPAAPGPEDWPTGADWPAR